MAKLSIPKHLRAGTKRWVKKIVATYELEDHHHKILILAAETWDRILEAREEVKKAGSYYTDFRGAPKSHPGLADERNNKITFARLIRELNLTEEGPESRPPGLKY